MKVKSVSDLAFKVKSVSDLAFRALDILTEGEDELWVAHIVFDGQARRTGGIQRIMKNDCGNSYDSVQRTLKRLVSKNIVYRVIQGIYAPNLKMLLPKMIELLEEKGAPNLPHPEGQTDKTGEYKTQERGG